MGLPPSEVETAKEEWARGDRKVQFRSYIEMNSTHTIAELKIKYLFGQSEWQSEIEIYSVSS